MSFTNLTKHRTVFAFASILIVGPTFGLFQDHREKMELTKNGVWSNSIVVDRKYRRSTGGSTRNWVIECKYEANNHSYETLYHDDLENKYMIGDTVKIIYSSQFPKIYAMGYEWKK